MFEVEIDAAPEALAGLRNRLRSWLAEVGVPDSVASDALIGVGEAATNAVEHAYAGADRGTVIVSASFHDGELRLSVADTGTWRTPGEDGGGDRRGLHIIRKAMRQATVHTSNAGTRVQMLQQRPDSA